VPIGEVARWTQEQFRGAAQKKGITLEVIGGDSLSVRGDADRVRQLFTILVDNAVTYTPEGGRVRVTWGRNGASAQVAFADTGNGIAPEDLPHVFDRFYRADRARVRTSGGSGLGLAIAQWIVKAHGGRIDIQSQLGAGTTVTVWLPLADRS
jgi:signal transduction histidine kinase